jgi:hypothetical protein
MRVPSSQVALGALIVAVLVAACGGGEKADPQQAFLQGMVPHHRSAVDMAEVAQTEAQTQFVKNLASDITRSQTEEIGQMGQIHERLFNGPLDPTWARTRGSDSRLRRRGWTTWTGRT